MEEVVFRVQLLVLVPKGATPFAQLVNSLLHLFPLEIAQGLPIPGTLHRERRSPAIVAFQLKQLFLELFVFFIGFAKFGLLVGQLTFQPLHFFKGFSLCELRLLEVSLHALVLK